MLFSCSYNNALGFMFRALFLIKDTFLITYPISSN
nr:MAG TPA: hypothetical protein [Caudoviricetes sp.]